LTGCGKSHRFEKGTTSQVAEKLIALKGHDITGCAKSHRFEKGTTSQVAEKLFALKGPGFSRAASGLESTWALAPEGSFSADSPPVPRFSAAC
jgi:hypothetical protein